MKEFHVGLLVKDVAKLAKFYENLFGVVPSVIVDNEYLEFSLEKKLIVDVESADLVKGDVGEMSDKFYLRLEVENIEEFRKKCEVEKVNVVVEPMRKKYGKTEMYLRDFEGNLVQVFQRLV